MRDVGVRKEDQPIVARRDPYAAFDGFDTQDVKPLSRVRHNLDTYVRIVMFPAALLNHLGEVLVEESHVEHEAPKVPKQRRACSLSAVPDAHRNRCLQGCLSPRSAQFNPVRRPRVVRVGGAGVFARARMLRPSSHRDEHVL